MIKQKSDVQDQRFSLKSARELPSAWPAPVVMQSSQVPITARLSSRQGWARARSNGVTGVQQANNGVATFAVTGPR